MSRLYTTLSAFLFFCFSLQATDHTIVTSGFTYSPAVLSVQIGDNVTIVASGNHPTTQVSETTWNADGITPLAGGFGTHTASFTFPITAAGIIYYVCDNHVTSGMKGQINVLVSGVDDLSQNLSVSFGSLPVADGLLRYTIESGIENLSTIEVMSIRGQRMTIQTITNSQGAIGLDVAAGLYVVIIRDNKGQAILSESITVK